MAIVADITNLLLSMIGLESVSDGPPSVQQEIIACLQEAQCLLSDLNPAYFYKVREGEGNVIRTPVDITLTVTQFEKGTVITGWQSWMAGCTILIDGDANYNRVLNSAVSGTVRTLQRPYMGTTGTKTATVWNDWVLLDSNIRSVCAPVQLDQLYYLTRAESLATITSKRPFDRLPMAGLPTQWYPLALTHLGSERAGILLNRLPTTQYLLSYDTRIAYTPITSLSDARTEILPGGGLDNAIFLPVVRFLFSSQPGCSTPKTELQDGFTRATSAALSLRVDGSRHKTFTYNKK